MNEKAFDQKRIATFWKDALEGEILGFVQVDIGVPNELYDTFSEVGPLLAV